MGTHNIDFALSESDVMSNSRLATVKKTSFHWNPNFQIPKSGGLVCLKKTWDEKRRRVVGWYWGGQVWGDGRCCLSGPGQCGRKFGAPFI